LGEVQGSTDSPQSEQTGIAVGAPRYLPVSVERTDVGPNICKDEDAAAQQVFVAWEILRLLYNAALLFVILIQFSFGAELPTLLFRAIIANVFFCVGPVTEGYFV
jgi:hypothetical protein